MGGDTVGDVKIVPSDEPPADPEAGVLVDDLSGADFEELFARSVSGGAVDRVGIPGVQAKVSAGVISFPLAGRAAHHILKLNPPEYARLVENESFFLAAARRCGLPAAPAVIVHDRNGRTGLLVERFDRVGSDPPRRLPQEDGCQVLGLRDGFAQVVFSYLIGSGDLHAKNLSIVEDPATGFTRIAPVYDLLSTLPYDDPRLALPVEGRHENVRRRDMLAFAGAIGFDQRRTHKLRRAILYRRDELTQQGPHG